MSKVPNDASKVFGGILFDIYHKQVEQFDGSYKTFEWIRGYDIVKSLCIVEDKIIIQEEYQPGGVQKVGLPGGFLEKGEQPIDAIKREILEETGYTFKTVSELTAISSSVGLLESYKYYFIAKDPIKQQSQQYDSGEKIIIHLYTFDQFIEGVLNNDIDVYELSQYIKDNYIYANKLDDFKKILFG